ncbi:MAG: hypothetical protein JRH13_14455 [Deltaproteobacteria bacterium]|nr:hypothetical protein [Deltaproteobacteria bacterium]MBW2018097.1 hypothetical protein [Deltaproteobacteria bacterium]MBW2130552.1 hypothetical protein [Deltaproteobacteria bacterium]
MALDEPRENDEIVDNNGITYLIEKNLFEQVKPITVDFVESAMGSGFSIQSSLNIGGGGGCGGCSSC